MHLVPINNNEMNIVEEMINEPLILKMFNGTIYSGLLDEAYFDEDWLCLYACQMLDEDHLTWIDHNIWVEFDGEVIRDIMPYFAFSNIEKIYKIPENVQGDYGLYEAKHWFIDPYFKPLQNVVCNGDLNGGHSEECDEDLHIALIKIRTYFEYASNSIEKEKRREFEASFIYLRRRLLKMGAMIP